MRSVIVEVADAVVAEINANKADLGLTVSAVRSYGNLEDPLETMDQLQVDVVPWIMAPETDAVGLFEYPMQVDVLVRKRFGASQQVASTGQINIAAVDELIRLTEAVWELFAPCQPNQTGRLTTAAGHEAAWEPRTARLMQLYVRQHLSKIRQFTGYLRLGYTVNKAV